jgi:hypothetical protein
MSRPSPFPAIPTTATGLLNTAKASSASEAGKAKTGQSGSLQVYNGLCHTSCLARPFILGALPQSAACAKGIFPTERFYARIERVPVNPG